MHVRQYWFAYDLSDDRERTRVERCLSRYGQRLQKSVFHCVLDVRRLSLLQGELEALACRSGAIVLAALAEPPQIVSIGKTGAPLAENWAFTLFQGHPGDAPAAPCDTPIQNLPEDMLGSPHEP